MLWVFIQVATMYLALIVCILAFLSINESEEWDEQQTYDEYLRSTHWNGQTRR